MQSKSFYTVSLLIFFWLNQLYSQSISDYKGPDQRFINIDNKETFSAKEMKIIKDNLNGSWVMSKYGLSQRESKEFLEKLK